MVSRDMARMSFLDYIDVVDDRVGAGKAGLDSSGCSRLELVILVRMSVVSRLTSPNPAMMRRGVRLERGTFRRPAPRTRAQLIWLRLGRNQRPAVSEPFFLVERGRYRDATHIVEMRSC